MRIADVRLLRLALGTAICLWFSQAIAWQLSFVAPIMTLMLLGMPGPRLPLKGGVALILILAVSLNAGMLLLPVLLNQTAVGVLLLGLALYWTFYFTARGGPPALGTFATLGIALSVAVGTVNLDLLLTLSASVVLATAVGVLFTWVAHVLLPDSLADDLPVPAAKGAAADVPAIDLARARRRALRSFVIVMPVAVWIVFSPDSTSYLPVMLKVAAMGQQVTLQDTRRAARSLLLSTLIGGVGAVIAWQLLSIVPALSIYTLLVGLAGLYAGRRMFLGPGPHPDAETWSYGYLTLLVLLAPAVTDGIGGNPASLAFIDRLWLFAGATLYATAAVFVVDAFSARSQVQGHPAVAPK